MGLWIFQLQLQPSRDFLGQNGAPPKNSGAFSAKVDLVEPTDSKVTQIKGAGAGARQ